MALSSVKTTSPSTISTGASATTESKSRQIIRDSGGNIIALIQTSSSAITPFISTDDGSTWTQGDTTMTADSADAVDCAIDANDNIGVTSQATANNTDALYNEFTISTSGTVTKNVTDETILSVNTKITDTAIVRDSTNSSWWISVQFGNKNMGTVYDNLRLYERSGGTYTNHIDYGSGSTNHTRPTMAIDSNGDVRLVWDKAGSTVWNKWDTSAAALVGQETIRASGYDGQVTVQSGNTYATVSTYVHERSGGTWSSDQYTSKSVAVSTIEPSGGELFVIFESGGDIYYNNNTFGSFTTGSDSTLQSGSNTYQEPSSRWQFDNDNEPGVSTADVLYYDNTNGDALYGKLQGLQTKTISELVSPWDILNVKALSIKKAKLSELTASTTSLFFPGYNLIPTFPDLHVDKRQYETVNSKNDTTLSKIAGILTRSLEEKFNTANSVTADVVSGIKKTAQSALVGSASKKQFNTIAPRNELIGAKEKFTRIRTLFRLFSEVTGILDTITPVSEYVKSSSSTVGMQSSKPTIAFILGSLATVFGSLEENNQRTFFTEIFQEIVDVSNSTIPVWLASKQLQALVGSQDDFLQSVILSRAFREKAGTIGSLSRTVTLTRTFDNIVGTFDDIVVPFGEILEIAEKLSIRDTKERILDAKRQQQEVTGIHTNLQTPASFVEVMSNLAGIIDTRAKNTRKSTAEITGTKAIESHAMDIVEILEEIVDVGNVKDATKKLIQSFSELLMAGT